MTTPRWSGGALLTRVEPPRPGEVLVYDLAQPLEPGMPRHPAHPPFAFSLTGLHPEHPPADEISATGDMLTMGGHVGTHVDALGHIACGGQLHGERSVVGAQSMTRGLAAGSIEEAPPLIGTGHLVDVPALLGRQAEPDDAIGARELHDWFSGRAEPRRGDIVLVRTGWIRHWTDAARYIGAATGVPGVSLDGARWLSERGITAAGSDTAGFEHRQPGAPLEVHRHLLVEAGIFILESLNLEQLAHDGVASFFFLAAPLRIRGGTGSPVRPMALVPTEDTRT